MFHECRNLIALLSPNAPELGTVAGGGTWGHMDTHTHRHTHTHTDTHTHTQTQTHTPLISYDP